jgi:hypothetical protein
MAAAMKNRLRAIFEFTQAKLVCIVLLFLLAAKIILIISLYRSGFISLTADDFGRVISAVDWVRQPFLFIPSAWLPFLTFLNGLLLKVVWNFLWTPRIFSISVGLGSIVLAYFLARLLFDDPAVGLLCAALLVVDPLHSWLSATTLTELPHAALMLGASLAFVTYLKKHQLSTLVALTICLTIANGIRLEAWVYSAIFSLTLAGLTFIEWRNHTPFRRLLPLILAAIIPCIVPFTWMVLCTISTGNPLYSLQYAQFWKALWYGNSSDFGAYFRFFFKTDPFLTIASPLFFIGLILFRRKSSPIFWYLCAVALLPFLVFIIMHGGRTEPSGNWLRYLAPYIFLMYPLFAWFLIVLSRRLLGGRRILSYSILLLFFLFISFFQIGNTFHFTNDPASVGLKVGQSIHSLVDGDLTFNTMIELRYWDYLAIHIGANDLDHVIYDRVYDHVYKKTTSIFAGSPQLARDCLSAYNIHFLVAYDPAVRHAIEDLLHSPPFDQVNGYSFYRVGDLKNANPVICTLDLGWPRR